MEREIWVLSEKIAVVLEKIVRFAMCVLRMCIMGSSMLIKNRE